MKNQKQQSYNNQILINQFKKQNQNLLFINKKLTKKIQDLQQEIRCRAKDYVQDLIRLTPNQNTQSIKPKKQLVFEKTQDICIVMEKSESTKEHNIQKSLVINTNNSGIFSDKNYHSERKKVKQLNKQFVNSEKKQKLINHQQYDFSNVSTHYQNKQNTTKNHDQDNTIKLPQLKNNVIQQILDLIKGAIKLMNQMNTKNIKNSRDIIKPTNLEKIMIQHQKQLKLFIAKFGIYSEIIKQIGEITQSILPVPHKIKIPDTFLDIIHSVQQLQNDLFNLQILNASYQQQIKQLNLRKQENQKEKEKQNEKKKEEDQKEKEKQKLRQLQPLDLQHQTSIQLQLNNTKQSQVQIINDFSKKSHLNSSNKLNKFKNVIKIAHGHNIVFEKIESCSNCKQYQQQAIILQKRIQDYYKNVLNDQKQKSEYHFNKYVKENQRNNQQKLRQAIEIKELQCINRIKSIQQKYQITIQEKESLISLLNNKIQILSQDLIKNQSKLQQSFKEDSNSNKYISNHVELNHTELNNSVNHYSQDGDINIPLGNDESHIKRKFLRKVINQNKFLTTKTVEKVVSKEQAKNQILSKINNFSQKLEQNKMDINQFDDKKKNLDIIKKNYDCEEPNIFGTKIIEKNYENNNQNNQTLKLILKKLKQ